MIGANNPINVGAPEVELPGSELNQLIARLSTVWQSYVEDLRQAGSRYQQKQHSALLQLIGDLQADRSGGAPPERLQAAANEAAKAVQENDSSRYYKAALDYNNCAQETLTKTARDQQFILKRYVEAVQAALTETHSDIQEHYGSCVRGFEQALVNSNASAATRVVPGDSVR